MRFDAECFNQIAEGDRLFERGIKCQDWTLRTMLFCEARRCYAIADLESMVKVIDRLVGLESISHT